MEDVIGKRSELRLPQTNNKDGSTRDTSKYLIFLYDVMIHELPGKEELLPVGGRRFR